MLIFIDQKENIVEFIPKHNISHVKMEKMNDDSYYLNIELLSKKEVSVVFATEYYNELYFFLEVEENKTFELYVL